VTATDERPGPRPDWAPAPAPPPARASLYEHAPDGGLKLHFHPGQTRAWDSRRRFVAVSAGSQSGKTSWGPWWLDREVTRCGPGDYLAVTATYDLFKLKMLPAMREVFEHVLGVGRYWASDRVIEIADPSTGRFWARRSDDPMYARVILRSADAEGGLESTTAKGAWLDEAGQDHFRVSAWEAVLRRLSLAMGRCLLTTTLYNFGWFKTEVHDRWLAGDPNFEVVQFDSTLNPVFPAEEWDRARATLPPWKFDMQYRGRFSRPAGSVYDCYADEPAPRGHLVPRFEVPPHWPRYEGLDFGGANTAGVFLAFDPGSGLTYAYREYHAGNLTAGAHAKAMLAGEPAAPVCFGGSPSEGQWRDEFTAGGLHVYRPEVGDVEIGINRVYAALKLGRLLVFDDLRSLRKQFVSYSRKLDKAGQPTAEIHDKHRFHHLDALRYIGSWLYAGLDGRGAPGAEVRPAGLMPVRRWGA
jgi:hypothetical protein